METFWILLGIGAMIFLIFAGLSIFVSSSNKNTKSKY